MLITEIKEEDNKFIKRTKKTLLKNFKISSYNQLDDAVALAVYLVAISRKQEAIDLLESFVHSVESKDDRRDLWGSVGQGVILLAYLMGLRGETEKERQLVQKITNDDYQSDRLTKAEFLAEDLAEHHENMDYYLEETHKYRCRILAQEILTFTYYYELLPSFQHQLHSSEKDVITQIISKVYGLLKNEILN